MSYKPRMTDQEKKNDKKVRVSQLTRIVSVPENKKSRENQIKKLDMDYKHSMGKIKRDANKAIHTKKMIEKRRKLNKNRRRSR